MTHKHLGRGLNALIPTIQEINQAIQNKNNLLTYININQIIPPQWQPRKYFDQEKLAQLAESIKSSGIIEPLIVTKKDDKYEIVCGERRYRASIIAGVDNLPVIIKELTDEQKSTFSLIENIQRENLNPIEEAQAYMKLIEIYKLTQEQLANIIGKDRSVIANTLRILSLPDYIKSYIQDGLISAGHARSLASIDNNELLNEVTKSIIENKLTVRDVENIVKQYKKKKTKQKIFKQQNADIKSLEVELQKITGCKVKILMINNTKGKLVISYNSLDDFDKIVSKLKK